LNIFPNIPLAGSKCFNVSLASVIKAVDSKTDMEEKLAAATRIKNDISTKEKELAILEDKKRVVVADIAALRDDKAFMSDVDIAKLREALDEVEKLIGAVQKTSANPAAGDVKSCPVCVQPMAKIFMCMDCFSLVCEACHKTLATCPICRCDVKANPMKRNEALEKTFAKI
jgi:hypothetical protein